jgi:hypothetical protein
VTGPLYGLQSKNGYDMAPNTKLTTAQLKRFFTPWKYAPRAMVWDGRYVSIQPVPKEVPAVAAAATPVPSQSAAPSPTPVASPSAVVSPSPSPSVSRAPAVAAVASAGPAEPGAVEVTQSVGLSAVPLGPVGIVVVIGAVAILVMAALAYRARRRRPA